MEHRFDCDEQNEEAPNERVQLLNGLEKGQLLNRSFAQEVHAAAVKFEPLNLAAVKIATKQLIVVRGHIAPLLLGGRYFTIRCLIETLQALHEL
jgi:hypothetical protein